jgi:hypothetical protein
MEILFPAETSKDNKKRIGIKNAICASKLWFVRIERQNRQAVSHTGMEMALHN